VDEGGSRLPAAVQDPRVNSRATNRRIIARGATGGGIDPRAGQLVTASEHGEDDERREHTTEVAYGLWVCA
jgi:hypothetical protein